MTTQSAATWRQKTWSTAMVSESMQDFWKLAHLLDCSRSWLSFRDDQGNSLSVAGGDREGKSKDLQQRTYLFVNTLLTGVASNTMEVDAGARISRRYVPSGKSLAKASFGLIAGFTWQCKLTKENREIIRLSTTTNIWARLVVHRKGQLGIAANVRCAVCDWIVNHESVVHSPIAKETLLVRLHWSTEKQRVGKLLLEIPVRELHDHLVSPMEQGGLTLARDKLNGTILAI
jgi:hypothetical protein